MQSIWHRVQPRWRSPLPWVHAVREAMLTHRTVPWFWVLRATEQIEDPVQVCCTDRAVFLEVGSASHWQKILSIVKRARVRSRMQGVVIVTPIPWLMQNMDWRTPLAFLKTLRTAWGISMPITLVFTHLEYFPQSADQLGGEVQGEIESWITAEYQRVYQQIIACVPSGKDISEKINFLLLTEKIHALFEMIKKACITLSTADLPWAGIYGVRGTQIILPPPQEILPTPEKKRRQSYFQWAFAAICVIGALSMIPLFQQAYVKNQALLEKAQTSSHQLLTILVREGRTPTEISKALIQSFSDYDALMRFKYESAFWERMGFYLGNKVRKPLEEIHLRVLQSFFMPMVGKAVEQQLAMRAMQWTVPGNRSAVRGEYYRLLKAYLMICFPHQLEVSDALSVLLPLWQQAWMAQGVIFDRGGDSLTRAQLIPPATFYLQRLSNSLAWTLDERWVNAARAALRTPFNSDNVYADLKSHGLATLGNTFFTVRAWQRWVLPEIKKKSQQGIGHDWVTETPLSQLSLPRAQVMLHVRHQSVDTLRRGLISAYLQDYVRAWWETVSGLRLQPQATLTSVTRALEGWSDPRGPFATWVKKITENFEAPEIAKAYPALSSFSVSKKAIAMDPLLKSYFALLSKIQIELETLALSADPPRDAALYTRRLLAGEATDSALYRASFVVEQRVKIIASPMEQAIVRHLLLIPLRAAWHVLLHETTLYVAPLWQTQVYQPYAKTVLNKFPFSTVESEASLEEVGEWLHPSNGRMTKFVQENLQPFLIQDLQGWQPRQWLGEGLAFSPAFLASLETQAALGRALNRVWQFYPEPHPGMNQVSFQIGGKQVRYYNGPQEWMSLHWPGKHPEWGAELTANGRRHRTGTLSFKGEWGMVRLLRASHLTPLPNGAYRVVCTVPVNAHQKWQITFRVRTAGEDFIPLFISHRLMLPEKVFIEHTPPLLQRRAAF